MPEFDKYMMRHGEHVIQDWIERMERYEGIVANTNLPLEQRWMALVQDSREPKQATA